MAGLKDFLTTYYYQLQFDSMPIEVKARLSDYVRKGDFAGSMKDWAEVDDLMDVDKSTKPPTYKLKANVVDAELTDDKDFQKLFEMFQSAFELMSADRKSFLYNKPANKFLDQWFGDSDKKLFSLSDATGACNDGIQALQALLQNNPLLVRYISRNKIAGLETDDDVDDFIQSKLDTSAKKYNTDGKVRQQIVQITNALIDTLSYSTFESTSPEYRAIERVKDKLDQVTFEQRNIQAKIDTFKGDYKDLLNTLFNSKKIRDEFSRYGSDITKYIDKAKEHIPYDQPDKKEYIPPKRDDELSAWQQLQKWTDDTYSNYFKKFVGLSGDRLFFSDKAKEIFTAIDKEKIGPKDGLGAILDKSDAIKKRIEPKSKQAAEHFDWFTKTLSAIKADKPKVFANALFNGFQMRSLVSEIIIRAVESGISGDIDKAKSSMELLASMQYGLHTSKAMDTLRKEKFVIFSDSKLSGNKNEAVSMVTKSLDGMFRVVVLGVGHVTTTITNGIRLGGNTFGQHFQHGKRDKTGATLAAFNQQQIDDNAQDKRNLQDRIAQKAQDIQRQRNVLSNLDLNQIQQDKQIYSNLINQAQGIVDTCEQAVLQWLNNPDSQVKPDFANVTYYLQGVSKSQLTFSDPNVEQMVVELDSARNSLNDTKQLLTAAKNKEQQYNDADLSIRTMDTQKQEMESKLATWDDDHKNQVEDLAKYWDMLQSGRTSHFGPMWSLSFGNAKDKKINPNFMNQFMQRHSYQMT